MNLVEAYKTGKVFSYRDSPDRWFDRSAKIELIHTSGEKYLLQIKEILDGWEVKEEKVEISKAQLGKAWDMSRNGYTSEAYQSSSFQDLCKELGL